MKLLTTIFDKRNLNKLLTVADGIILTNDALTGHITKSFSIEEINELLITIKKHKKEAFIYGTLFLYDDFAGDLSCIYQKVNLDLVDGIIVSDIGMVGLLDKLGQKEKIIYHPNTLLTNIYDFNALAKLAIKGAFLSEELTIDESKVILSKKEYQAFLVGFGYLNMFHSRRKLITNFNEYNGISVNKKIAVFEETRPNSYLNIQETNFGTYLYRSSIMVIDEFLDELEELDYLLLDGIFLDDDIIYDALRLYRHEINKEDFKNKYTKYSFDSGFFTKKLIYKKD